MSSTDSFDHLDRTSNPGPASGLAEEPGPDLEQPASARSHDLRDWLSLQARLALRPQLAIECLNHCTSPAAALVRSGRGPALTPAEFEPMLRVFERLSARAVPWRSENYPRPLTGISDPAPVLLLLGDPQVFRHRAVAIVGARAATVSGLEMAGRVARVLARAGVVVVSGLARGIDAAAHRGALAANGQTIAVLACGLDCIYPREHRTLAEEIRQRGAVMTEFPFATPPLRAHFPLRNRLISGLCEGVIVIEARERSGSLITANHALEQGRDVMAMPGSVNAPTSFGPNRLIRDGATPLLEPEDALEWLGIDSQLELLEASGAHLGKGHMAPSNPPSDSQAILSALAEGPVCRDGLARRLGKPPHDLAMALIDLELDGVVQEDRDGCLHVVRPCAAVDRR